MMSGVFGKSGVYGVYCVRAMVFVFVAGMFFGGTPVFAQGNSGGPQTIEPTLAECQEFVEENGIPETRPLQPNRGYSGYDVCLNMAYDGDLEGYFASADVSGDGVLQSSEQATYLDTVIGPASDPDQSPLTLEKCDALIVEYGIPEARPFVDWGNRGYGEVEICQAMAYDGDLAGSFASWDSNGDGRMDRSEQNVAVDGFSNGSSTPDEAGRNEPMTSLTLEACDAYIQERGLPETDPLLGYEGGSALSYNIAVCQSIGLSGDLAGGFAAWDANANGVLESGESAAYAESVTGAPVQTPEESAAAGQYEDTGSETPGSTGAEDTEVAAEGSTAESSTAGESTGSVGAGSDTQEPTSGSVDAGGQDEASGSREDRGVLSAVTRTIGGILPDSGGVALAGIVAAAVLILGGGFLAYRNFRG